MYKTIYIAYLTVLRIHIRMDPHHFWEAGFKVKGRSQIRIKT